MDSVIKAFGVLSFFITILFGLNIKHSNEINALKKSISDLDMKTRFK